MSLHTVPKDAHGPSSPPSVVFVNLFADGPHAPVTGCHMISTDAADQIANASDCGLGAYLGSLRVERDRHRLTAAALDLENEADRFRRDQEKDARLEVRHAVGLRRPSL